MDRRTSGWVNNSNRSPNTNGISAPWNAPWVWTQKREWVEKYLGKNAYKRLILSHNKHLMIGDYLIDDRTKNGAGEFKGELIQFGTKEFPGWDSVLNYLKP